MQVWVVVLLLSNPPATRLTSAVRIVWSCCAALQAVTESFGELYGHPYLFKRSLTLIKAWCKYESRKHTSGPILGAREGVSE